MMLITLIGKIMGLAREILIGAAFGSVGEGAAFNLASTLPRDFLDVAFASAISGCFIPVFNSTLEKRGREAAFALAANFMSVILVLTAAITAAAMIFSREIAVLMGPGLDPATQELAGRLFKITLPLIVLSGAAFLLIGVLQSLGEFNIPAAMSIAANGAIIAYCLFFVRKFGVYGLAVVFLAGWALQIVIQIPALKKAGYWYRFRIDLRDGGLKEIAAMILPVMASTWTQPVNNMVNVRISTFINDAASVAYVKANVLYSVVMGVFVLSVANFVFPELTKINARGEDEKFGNTLKTSMRGLFYLLSPISLGLFVLSGPLARLVFRVGKYDDFSAYLTASALSWLSLGMLGFGLQTILSRAFYARKNVKTPLITGIAAIAINAALSSALWPVWGVGAPAFASGASFTFSAAGMLIFMYKKNKYVLDLKTAKDAGLMLAASLVMAAAVRGAYIALAARVSGRFGELLCVALPTVLGAAVYLAATSAFRIGEAVTAIGILRKFTEKLKNGGGQGN
jgi:murein biosynthesis integral membrane protein MurJ